MIGTNLAEWPFSHGAADGPDIRINQPAMPAPRPVGDNRPMSLRRTQSGLEKLASPFVRRFAHRIVSNASGPILDVACGSGRNAFLLASLGATVVGVDRDLSAFDDLRSRLPVSGYPGTVKATRVDLDVDEWSFGRSSLGGVIKVHYFLPKLFPRFCFSIAPGGYVLFESVGGQGGNYLQLPRAGDVARMLSGCFEVEHYHERAVGPRGQDAVAVRVLARRLNGQPRSTRGAR
jgi:SAM-dependent methyltransferase